MQALLSQLKSARRCSVPLVSISTPDPWATVEAICEALRGEKLAVDVPAGPDGIPLVARVEWDYVRGMTGRNTAGQEWVKGLGEFDETQHNPFRALVVAQKLPPGAVLFFHLAHRFIQEPAVIQAVANLRDPFKGNQRTLCLLGQGMTLPPELQGDVVALDEPLPGPEELSQIVGEAHEAHDINLDTQSHQRAVEAIQGLPAFQAEQVVAMCLRREGVDVAGLWQRKRDQVEQTPGLKVFHGGEAFEAVGGCEVVKDFLTRIMQGKARPNAVVFIDEIEKMLGGKGDTSGVSQDQLGTILSYMQDQNAAGMIFVGPPGAAKSAVAKAAGNVAGIPTIQLDLGAAKGSLVGQSEQQMRTALKVITAVSNGRSLWVATCNSIAELPPELRRRFTLGTFFFDLPTEIERAKIWHIYAAKYPDLDMAQRPADDGWTGAEIRQCCDIAWRIGCTLREAAAFVVPVSRSAADALERLRSQAEGRFLSASYPGVYQRSAPEPATGKKRRAFAHLPESP